jgi:hypothetical protein
MNRNRAVPLAELKAARAATNNVRRHAAARLGIPETSLAKQMAQFRIEGEEFPKPDQTMWHKPNWEPTPEEIEAACKVIQAGWTPRDFGLRCWTERRKWFAPLIEGVEDFTDVEW